MRRSQQHPHTEWESLLEGAGLSSKMLGFWGLGLRGLACGPVGFENNCKFLLPLIPVESL